MKPHLFLALLSCFFISCERWNPCRHFSELSIEAGAIDQTVLRLDGYYYLRSEDSSVNQERASEFFVLYENGVAYHALGGTFEQLESSLRSAPNIFFSYDHRDHWGLFSIDGDSIAIENWYPRICGKPSILMEGHVLNDSSFILTRSLSKNSNSTVVDSFGSSLTYSFRQFGPKPDSTNDFVP